MSKYTTEVRYICENYAGLTESQGYGNIDDVIDKALPKLFDFDFPIYDESYRTVLEKKIVRHYYTREIGMETVGLWKHYLSMKLNEIMPYYNQLYKSTLLEFNPLYDVDITTDHTRGNTHDETTSDSNESHYTRTDDLTRTDTGSTENSSSSESTSQESHTTHNTEMYSDTPQGELTDVIAGKYLTQARVTDNDYTTDDASHYESTDTGKSSGTSKNTGTQKGDGTTSGSGTRNFNSTEDYLEHVRGKRNGVSYSALLEEYRKTFINIDVMIINELKPLFMNIW